MEVKLSEELIQMMKTARFQSLLFFVDFEDGAVDSTDQGNDGDIAATLPLIWGC